jgi:hypothetical protein
MTMRANFSIECCNNQSGGEAKRLQQTALLLKTYDEAPGESVASIARRLRAESQYPVTAKLR